jgi:hypothetical protein
VPTLADLRSTFSVEVGPYVGPESYVVRATSGSDTTKLVCSQYPIMSGIPQVDSLIDRPLYRPTAVQELDRNRYVMDYDPPTGTITPDLPWIFPPFSLTTGNSYGFLEGYTYGDWEMDPPGYLYQDLEGLGSDGIGERFEILGAFDVPTTHRLINDGLKNCWVVVEVPCLPTAGATRHDLGVVAPWLQDANNVLEVGVLSSGQDRNAVDPFDARVYGEVEHDGGTFYLNTQHRSFSDGDILYLRCLKRAFDHCRAAGGVWGEQSGLSLDTDEAPSERAWSVASALVIAWRRFGHLLEPAANQRLIRDQAAAGVWFADRSRVHLTAVRPQIQFTRRRSFGPAFVA